MKFSTVVTMLALGLPLCACGETDDPMWQDVGSITALPDGAPSALDGGRDQSAWDAARAADDQDAGAPNGQGAPGDQGAAGGQGAPGGRGNVGGQGPDEIPGPQRPEDAGQTPEDSGSAPREDAGAPQEMDPPATTFTRVYQILSGRCAPCHTTSTPRQGGLDLSSKAIAYGELVGQGAEGLTCRGRTRVVAGDAERSLLIRKLRGTQDCGSRMPTSRAAALPESLIDEIVDWIEAGAKND
jgi:hypothetical protein